MSSPSNCLVRLRLARTSIGAERQRVFVDTNVIVYAHDATAGSKRDRARQLLLDSDVAAEVISDLAQWRVHRPEPADVLRAIQIHRRAGLSLWDAMIVRSAAALGCAELYSGDMSSGQTVENVRIIDPFA